MTVQILPFSSNHIRDAARLFVTAFARLRKQIQVLPAEMENPTQVEARLDWILHHGEGLAAQENGRLVGYFTWMAAEDFRGVSKTAAYVPEWGHSAESETIGKIYAKLFTEAAGQWDAKNFPIWAVTCLANNHFLERFLFHNGFGMIVQDAVRSTRMRKTAVEPGLQIRKCSRQDAELIAVLDLEHCDHYTRPPILMTPRQVETPAKIQEFLSDNVNSYWIAEMNGNAVGFLRFEGSSTGAAAMVRSDKTVAINGAFVLPQYRGYGAATATLQAALADYARQGFTTCSVDYETINPEAFRFWQKYFKPVCFSVVRYPEKYL